MIHTESQDILPKKNIDTSKTSIQSMIWGFRELLAKILEDPTGSKRRRWERYDEWLAEVKKMADNKTNRRFLMDNGTIPPYPRPKSIIKK